MYYLIPLSLLIVAQILKLIIESYRGQFSWNHLLSNGGMPSSHIAMLSSITTLIALVNGFNNPLFALAAALTIVVAWDAVHTRYQIGYQGKIINRLIKELPDQKEFQYPLLTERVGHTPLEVLAGFVLGVVLTPILLYLITF